MAEALGHPIDLCSRLGHGTRFSLIAPWAGNVDTQTRAPAPIRCAQSYGLGGAKVVVIDNDISVLEAMQSLLERWTCEVCLVRDLEEIDALIGGDGFQPDIILADYHLDGGACGLAAVDALREAAGAQVPAVVITADRAASIGDEARERGCEVLLKPVKPAELRVLMLHLVASAASSAP
jgi:CheY-like chemotaxis protein